MNHNTVIDETAYAQMVERIDSAASLSEMERTLRRFLQQVGNILLHLWLLWLTPRYNEASVACPLWADRPLSTPSLGEIGDAIRESALSVSVLCMFRLSSGTLSVG